MATVGSLQKIGDILGKNRGNNRKNSILAWLDSSPEIYEDLWEMIDTGLIWNFRCGQEKTLPRSCTQWNKVSAYIKLALLKRGEHPLTKDGYKLMKTADSKVLDKLTLFKFQTGNSVPLSGGIPIKDFHKIADALASSNGMTVWDKFEFDEDTDDIDWTLVGMYGFCKLEPDKKPTIITDKEKFGDATHIVHKPSMNVVEVKTLGIVLDQKSTIKLNWDDKRAEITTGKRNFTQIFPDFENTEWFKTHEQRMTHEFGSNEWQKFIGDDIHKARQAVTKEITAKQAEVDKLLKSASSQGIAPTGRKRRRIA